MTERISALKQYQWDKRHHAFRLRAAPEAAGYQLLGVPDYERTALRLTSALQAETPVILPGEMIAFTRTVPNLPMIYTDKEWEDIRKKHTIHENGNVCNLSPDYSSVIRVGLLALRDTLTDTAYHQAMAISIDAVLDLAGRYRVAAEKAAAGAELVIDNGQRNWLTALFAGEYAGLFTVLLPALARWRLPMPLGGIIGLDTAFPTQLQVDYVRVFQVANP
mgnify:CR=1 FL=1